MPRFEPNEALPIAIPDTGAPGTISVTFDVTGVTWPPERLYVDQFGQEFFFIEVSIYLPHTFVSDIDAKLIAPGGGGHFMRLSNGDGNSNIPGWGTGPSDDQRLIFSDRAGRYIGTDTVAGAVMTGAWQPKTPFGNLTAWGDIPGNGTWTLQIFDYGGGDVGTLEAVSLFIGEAAPGTGSGRFEPNEALPVAVPDNGMVERTFTVSGIDLVEDVQLSLYATDPFSGELQIEVESPSGIVRRGSVGWLYPGLEWPGLHYPDPKTGTATASGTSGTLDLNGKIHDYAVSAVTDWGETENLIGTDDFGVYRGRINLVGTGTAIKRVSIDWADIAGASGYRVYRSIDDGPWHLIWEAYRAPNDVMPASTVVDSGLPDGPEGQPQYQNIGTDYLTGVYYRASLGTDVADKDRVVLRDDADKAVRVGRLSDMGGPTARPVPVVGEYMPDESFHAFRAEGNPNGVWKVRVTDLFPGDLGTLHAASLFVNQNAPATRGLVAKTFELTEPLPHPFVFDGNFVDLSFAVTGVDWSKVRNIELSAWVDTSETGDVELRLSNPAADELRLKEHGGPFGRSGFGAADNDRIVWSDMAEWHTWNVNETFDFYPPGTKPAITGPWKADTGFEAFADLIGSGADGTWPLSILGVASPDAGDAVLRAATLIVYEAAPDDIPEPPPPPPPPAPPPPEPIGFTKQKTLFRKASASTGEKQHRARKASRGDKLLETFRRLRPPLRLNSQQFRFILVRPDLGNRVADDILESVEWRDEGNEENLNTIPILRGSATFRKPPPGMPGRITIADGHLLRCEVRWFDTWKPLWEMRLTGDRLTLEDGAWQFDMSDDMSQLALTFVSCRYRKEKKHPKGWFYHQIVRAEARKYGVPLGKIARGTERITNFTQTDVPLLEVFRQAMEAERKLSGRPMVMRWAPDSNGRFGLSILPMRRNPILYLFKEQIRSATLGHQRRGTLATVLIATGFQKRKGSKKRKRIKVKVTDKRGRRRYGFIQREERVKGNVESVRALRAKAKRILAKGLKPVRLIENFTHPGIAFIRRGDAIRVSIPSEGYSGDQGVVFVTSAVHSLSAGDYTMSLALGFVDPVDPEKLKHERERAIRAKKRKAKGKKKARA